MTPPYRIPKLVAFYNGVAFALVLAAVAYIIAYRLLPPVPAGGIL